jgi:hypothetical protein
MLLEKYWLELLLSNSAAIILLLVAIYRPQIARVLFSLLFVWAAFTNWITVHNNPQVYQEYETMALLPFYKDFIKGFFAEHTISLVSFVAISQLLIGISLLLKGWVFRLACIGGIIFLLAILPLGVGSGFPCTLIMAAGLFMVLKKNKNHFIWEKGLIP